MSEERAVLTDAQAERLERYRAGRMTAAEREAFERDSLADDTLAGALYSAEALATLARPRRRAAAPWRELALAAALLAVFTVAWWRTVDRESPVPVPVRRGAEATVRLLAPAGDVATSPERFTWTPDAFAASYRFELGDELGRVVATRIVRDTSLAAEDLGVALPAAGHWGVVPLAADGSERPAPAVMRFAVIAR